MLSLPKPQHPRLSTSPPPSLSRASTLSTQPLNVHPTPSILLMPTVRNPRPIPAPSSPTIPQTTPPTPSPLPTPRSPRIKPTTTKLIRARSSSHSNSHSQSQSLLDISTPPVWTSAHTGSEWLGLPLKFDIVQDHLEIQGYQVYAVEKWSASFYYSSLESFPNLRLSRIVERNRPVTVLTVYTGDPSHKVSPPPPVTPSSNIHNQITVTALSPSSSLTPADAKSEWENALHHLRRDGARTKEVLTTISFSLT